MGKGKIHYIEVVSDSEDEMDEEGSGAIYNIGMHQEEEENISHAQEEDGPMHHSAGIKKATIASISGVPMFNTFWIKGVVQGQASDNTC
jgi:hypothetical protein